MKLSDVLTGDCLQFLQGTQTKKRVFQAALSRLVLPNASLDSAELLERFLARERLGSTGIGQGIAIPHIRLSELEKPLATLLLLDNGIDFDAPDQQPVDVLFVLMASNQNPKLHLSLLANIADFFANQRLAGLFREAKIAKNADEIKRLLLQPEEELLLDAAGQLC